MKSIPLSKQAIGAYLSIYLIWGSTYLAIAYALDGIPPFLLSGIRYILAGLILYIWTIAEGERAIGWHEWGRNAISGVLALVGGIGMVTWSEQYISSAEAAVAGASTPFWFLILDKSHWKQNFSNKKLLIGFLLGSLGLIVFVVWGNAVATTVALHISSKTRFIAFTGLILGGRGWVVGSLYFRDKKSEQSMVMNVAQQLLLAGLASFIIATFQNEWTQAHWQMVGIRAWLSLVYLSVFGSAIAYIAYSWLLHHGNAALISTHIYVNPVIAVVLGALFLQQSISAMQYLGMALILLGLFFTLGTGKKS